MLRPPAHALLERVQVVVLAVGDEQNRGGDGGVGEAELKLPMNKSPGTGPVFLAGVKDQRISIAPIVFLTL